jgi:hypothetical protein
MAINLTTPVPVADITHQGVTKIEFSIPHYFDGNSSTMKMNKPDTMVVFIVATWDGDGNVLSESRHMAAFPDWPQAFTTDVRAVYSRVEQYAISQGFIGAGTAEAV